MTDDEIIKAFTACITSEDCSLCPMFRNCPTSFELQKQALDLIKRHKAEIERLKKGWKADVIETSNIKAEAVKEFAERLKDKSEHFWEEKENFVSEEQIDNLVKEMVGEG